MQSKYILLIFSLLTVNFLYSQKNKVVIGSKKETKKQDYERNKSRYLKFYPTNLFRGDLSIGYERPLGRYLSVEPIIGMTFKNYTEIYLNDESDFAEQSYIGYLTLYYDNFKFMPSYALKTTIKLFPNQHDDLEGDYYALGIGFKNYKIKQNVNFGNFVRITNVHETEYKFLRGGNIMNKNNFNFEAGIGTGLRNFKYSFLNDLEVYDPLTGQYKKEISESKFNYYSLTLYVYFNLGIHIGKQKSL